MTREELLKSIEDTKRYIKKKMLKMTCLEALRDFIDFYIRAYLNKRDENNSLNKFPIQPAGLF